MPRQRRAQHTEAGQLNFAEHVWSKDNQMRSKFAQRSAAASRGGSGKRGPGRHGLSAAGKAPKRPGRLRIVKALAIVVLALVVVGGGAFGIDQLLNGNKIYDGISIGEVSVSGMTKDEATQAVSDYYVQRVADHVPTFFTSQEAEDNPQSAENAESIEEQTSYKESLENRTQWTLPASKLDATFNVDAIVQEAYEIGRSQGGLIGRIQAALQGRNLEPECTFNETTLQETLDEMTAAVGTKRENYGVELDDDGIASVTEGHDGNEVVRDWLTERLNECYLGDGSANQFVLETQYMPLQIDEGQAQSCADTINASIEAGVNFTYEDQTWNAQRTDIAPWITTSVEAQGDGWILKPQVDENTARKALLSSLHSNIDQSNLEVTIDKDDQGNITVSSNATGTVPLVTDAVNSMNDSFFVSESRTEAPTITLSSTDLPSQVSFEEAQDLGLITEISSFTTQYSSGAEARTNNIHTAANLLNNSIAKANNGTWSFNDTAGEATEDKGYQSAGAIVGGEYSDAIGGGICQVATTVFNAVYDAGYPVKERHNHSLHIESYPEGRDAAIAYPDLDLIWENDTTSDVILVMSYTNSSVTASLWGVDPGYEVSTEYGEWQEGEPHSVKYKDDDTVAAGTEYVETTGVDGSSISIVRTVKDASGKVLHQDRFDSTYAPKNEVIVRGTAQ